MDIISGGFTKIEFDDSRYFLAPTEIRSLLKNGTSIIPESDTEEFSDGAAGSVLKKMIVSIRSADNDNGELSAYERLTTAEENRTPLHFRFYLMNGKVFVLNNVLQVTKREVNEIGKFNSLDIDGVGVADSEDLLWQIKSREENMLTFQSGSNFGAATTNYAAAACTTALTGTPDGLGRTPLPPGVYDLMQYRALSDTHTAPFTVTFRVSGSDTELMVTVGAGQVSAVDDVHSVVIEETGHYGTLKFYSASGGGLAERPAVSIRHRPL